MKVLLSIKPEFVKEIFSGKKKYEYRKSIFTRDVDKVIVYSTKPVGMIVGEFSIEKILVEAPSVLWEKTQKDSGISKKFFDDYFEGRGQGYALKISSPTLYDKPRNPLDVIKSFVAPQSFKYIEEDSLVVG